MACKLILFVSPLRPGAAELDYTCPNGDTVSGAQTNEAPAKYLLGHFGDVSQLLGIVTPQSAPAWEYLTRTLSDFCAARGLAAPAFCPVPLEEEQAFAQEALPVLLAYIGPGDTLLLETTGGFRNAMMYLLLLSRILSYTGVPVAEAVYSNFQSREISSVSQLFSMFQLAEGMQNLSAFGSVEALRAYYAGRPQPAGAEALLCAMERLTEAIALCRTRQIDACMEQFNAALAQLEGADQTDPLLQELLPVFRSKFGRDGRMTTPTLIRWCADNGMLQQALTVYTEQMPVYLLSPDQGRLIQLDESVAAPPDPPPQPYERRELAYFLRSFLHLSRRKPEGAGRCAAFRQYIQNNVREIETAARFGRPPRQVPEELQPAIRRVVELVRAAEPCLETGRWDGRWVRRVPFFCSEALTERINQAKYKSAAKMINDFQVFGSELVAELFGERPDRPAQGDAKGGNAYLDTLRKMELLLPGSGWRLRCSLASAKTLTADYIYVKFLRNMTNHANDVSQDSQRETLKYLYTLGYPEMDGVSAPAVKQVLHRALEHLRQAEEELAAAAPPGG